MDRRPNVAATMDGGSCVKTQHYVFARRRSRRSNPVFSMIDGLGDRQHRVASRSGELRSSQIAPGDWVAALEKVDYLYIVARSSLPTFMGQQWGQIYFLSVLAAAG
jgi:hypothetical protein